MGITMPVWLCNTLFFAFAIDEETVNKNDDEARNYLQLTGLIGAFISIPTLFIPALVKMFVDISSNIAFYIGLGIEIAIIIAFIVSMRNDKKKSRK